MSRDQEKQWLQEYEAFLNSEEVPPPRSLDDKIYQRVARALTPRLSTTLTKLAAVHILTAAFSLGFCDQMGVQPWSSGLSLSHYFMELGHAACMLLCGFLFISLSVFVAWLALSKQEFKQITQHSHSIIPGLSLASFLALHLLGAEVSFVLAIVWMLGAFIGGGLPAWGLHWLNQNRPAISPSA